IYEVPYGIKISDVLALCRAENAGAVQMAGAAGETVPASEFERQILFEDLSTGGSLIVFNEKRDLLDMVENFAEFFVHESCGFCTPCRVGGVLLRDLVKKVKAGRASNYDVQEMEKIASMMQKTAFCGLGSTAPNAVLDSLKKLPQIYQSRLQQSRFIPAFDLDAALGEAREIAGREDRHAHLEQNP
ncbi:MAG: NADP oxidoreductase, partial [Gammaproteobacteria bacterium]|nr:NADP oxidoreductase [Gammaproteobacteria bacterium]